MTGRSPLGHTVVGVIAGLVFAACATAVGPADPTPPVATSTPRAQQASATPTAAVSSTAPPTAVAEPSASASAFGAELISPDGLVICSSFNRTRFAERDADGKPFGVDIEIGEAVADVLSVEPEIVEMPFDELIDAVVDRQCDVSIAGQFITQDRLARVDMIPYREGAPHVIVAAGNPLAIDELTDLCARRFAVVSGAVYVDMVRGAGDYAGSGIDDGCDDAGMPSVDLREYGEQQAAEDALARGEVDAYAGNDFVTVERPLEFELAFELPKTRNGIGHRLDASALDTALRDALRALIADGQYLAILERYGAGGAALTITP